MSEGIRAVSIVVLNWNGRDDTLACLKSVQQLKYPKFNVLVVDNGSRDGSVSAIRSAFPNVEVIETGANLGFAAGNNVGIARALEQGADFILLLNNDTVVDAFLLDAFVDAATRHSEFSIFGARLLYMEHPDTVWFDGAEWIDRLLTFHYPGQGAREGARPWDIRRTDYACGAALFFRADVARIIGLLDARFFLVFEESDWCFRARRAGLECCVVPSAKVWHKVGASFGSEASPLRTYFSARNALLWAEKNIPRRSRLRVLAGLLSRACPRFALMTDKNVPLAKRVIWAAATFISDLRRRAADPQELALRRGIRDYLMRRFGDCPPVVREWSQAWATVRQKS